MIVFSMQIGRFFSAGQGRVGQYLSPRVLVIKTPFQPASVVSNDREISCFGFETLKQAQTFVKSLAQRGVRFQLRQSQILMQYPYEVVLANDTALAQTLAFWERRDRHRVDRTPTPLKPDSRARHPLTTIEPDADAIAA
jgi:hypothetical protein